MSTSFSRFSGPTATRNVIGWSLPRTLPTAAKPSRESYGGEVAYESWRRQFRGKRAADSLRVGREIRGISGATISVHAVTLGVQRLLAALTAWHQRGALR